MAQQTPRSLSPARVMILESGHQWSRLASSRVSKSPGAVARSDTELGSAAAPADGPADIRRRLLFGVGTVFDLGQTDGDPLPTIDVPVLTGDEGAALYGRMETVALEEDLIIERDERRLSRPQTMGLYSPTERLIVIREAAQRQMTKTLAHELAHHFGQARRRLPTMPPRFHGITTPCYVSIQATAFSRSLPTMTPWYHDTMVS
jgi:hypothetical protein